MTRHATATNSYKTDAKSEKKINNIATVIALIIVGGPIIAFLVIGIIGNSKPRWQFEQDEEIEYVKKNEDVNLYMMERFSSSLRPDGEVRNMDDHAGHLYSYKDLYDYNAEKLGYECTQLAPYSDHTPMNEMVECHKKK